MSKAEAFVRASVNDPCDKVVKPPRYAHGYGNGVENRCALISRDGDLLMRFGVKWMEERMSFVWKSSL